MNPSLPDALQLRDIHLPGTPGIWPPAPGWWIAAVVVLALLSWLALTGWRYLQLRRQRRHILGLLAQLEQSAVDTCTPEFVAQLSRLLRRIALMRFPAEQIASLTGKDWLKFLDETGGNGGFSTGPGQVLADGPYVRDLPGSLDIHTLTPLIRDWIGKNAHA